MNLKIPQATEQGYIEVEPYGAFDWSYPSSLTRRGRVIGGVKSALQSCVRTRSMYMKVYGLSRQRGPKGDVMKWIYNNYVNAIHTSVGHPRLQMGIFIVEIDEYEADKEK